MPIPSTDSPTVGIVEALLTDMTLPYHDHQMTPLAFVERWLPVQKGKAWGDWGSRKSAQELLAQATGYTWNTANNWLSDPDTVPDLVYRHLWLLNQVWSFQENLSQSAENST